MNKSNERLSKINGRTSRANSSFGYVPNIDIFFDGEGKKTLEDIMSSKLIEQDELRLDSNDLYDNRYQTVESDEYVHADSSKEESKIFIKNILERVRVNYSSYGEIYLFCDGRFVEKYKVAVSATKKYSKKKSSRVFKAEYKCEEVQVFDMDEKSDLQKLLVCPVKFDLGVANKVKIFVVAKQLKNSIKIIKCGIID